MQSPQFQVHAELEQKHWWFVARRRILRTLAHAVLPPSQHALVIDVGCGTGGNTAAFAEDYTCIGIDPIAEAIELARIRFPGKEFRQGYAPRDVKEEFGSADLVLLLDVLEHVEHDRAFVAELIAAMKPGACLLMLAPADPSLWSPHDRGFEHFRRYERSTFEALWDGANVEPLIVSYCNAYLYPVVKLLRTMSRFTGKAWGSADTDLQVPMRPLNAILTLVFASEANLLLDLLKGKRKTGFSRGVSILGLLRKKA